MSQRGRVLTILAAAACLAALTLGLMLAGAQSTLAKSPAKQNIVRQPQAGEVCFATIDASTVYSSTDSQAVRDAVAAASDGDLIKIAGTCAGVDSGNLAVISGMALTLQGGYTTTNWMASDPVANPTILDAESAGRVINTDSTLTLSGLTLQNGSSGSGGAIYSTDALTVANSDFISNTTSSLGGAIYTTGALNISGSTIRGNRANGVVDGTGSSAIWTAGDLVMDTTNVLNNYAGMDYTVYAEGMVNVTNSLFQNNELEDDGGALYVLDDALYLANSSFIENISHGSKGSSGNCVVVTQAGGVITGAQFLRNTMENGAGTFCALDMGDVTLTDSDFISNTVSLYGGGIYATTTGMMTVSNSDFISNTASDGGAIFYAGGALDISHSDFVSNTAATQGGAIYANGAFNVSHSNFISNTASGAGPAGGGAIYLSATTVYIANSTFEGNRATNGWGGGIHTGSGALTVVNSTLAHNHASHGGALHVGNGTSAGSASVTNSTIYSNTASGTGGGVRMGTAASASFYNSTIANNDGASGAGLSEVGTPTFNLVNTIVANNTGSNDCESTSGVDTDTNNLIETNTGCGSPTVTADPQLGPLQDNGGDTWTMALLPGSPAIDAGDNASAPSTDQRGVARPQGCVVDIGAFEAAPDQELPAGVCGAALWLDASDPDADGNPDNDPSGGDPLTTWVDKSGMGNDATVAAGQSAGDYITTTTDLINGHPLVRFNRTDDANGSVYEAAGVDIRSGTNEDVTIFSVYRPLTLVSANGVWGNDNGGWDRFFLAYHASFGDGINDGLASKGPVGQGQVVPDAGITNTVRLLTVKYDGNGATDSSVVYFDGQVITRFSDSTDPTNAQDRLYIGWDGDSSTFSGDIAEMIVFNRALTDEEVCQVSSYLGDKYGRPFECQAPGGVLNGLELWLKANAGVTETAGIVSGWADQSGSGNDALQGNTAYQPALVTETLNFNPAIDFESADYFGIVDINMQTTDNGAIFAVFQDYSSHLLGLMPAAGDDAEDPQLWVTSQFGLFSDTPSENQSFTHPGAMPSGQPHVGQVAWFNTPAASTLVGLNGYDLTSTIEVHPGDDVGISFDFLNNSGAGKIGEIVIYNSALTPESRNKVDSYLALKYGITLTGTQGINYTLSDDTVVWDADANAAYHHDVAGIGIDAGSALTQTKSRSVNADSLITVTGSLGNMSDGEFLVWGNNDADASSFSQTAGGYLHLARVWKVQETGDVGAVEVGADSAATHVLVSSSADFTGASVYNVGASIDLNDGEYFTLAQVKPAAPGGVAANLGLWLKANAGVYADAGATLAVDGDNVLQWHDQTGYAITEAQIAATNNITYLAGVANFNPSVQFDGANGQSLQGTAAAAFYNAATILAVANGDTCLSANSVCGVLGTTPTAGGQGIYHDVSGAYVVDGAGASPSNSAYSADLRGQFHILGGQYTENTTNNSSMFADGALVNNRTGGGTTVNSNTGFEIGGRTAAGLTTRIFNGQITEVIYYATVLTSAERNKVESYLALKYGVTLTGTQGISYTLSDDMVAWDADANAAYHNDVAGISIDAGSALTQTMSRSINDDSIVTIGDPADLGDGEALVWGNDDGVLTGTLEVPSGYFRRLAREWLVQETGDAGSVSVSFDLGGVSDTPNFVHTTGFALLIDSDGDFSDAMAVTGATVNGSVVTFGGVGLSDGDYFSLAYPKEGDPWEALALGKTAEDVNGAPLNEGDEILYTLVVTNLLGVEQTGIVITDAIPASTTYVGGSAQVSQGSVSGPDPLVADVGALSANAVATFTFRVTVEAGATGQTIQNSAQADSPNQKPPLEVGPIEPPGGGTVEPPGGPITGIEIDYGPGTAGENTITGTIGSGEPATYTWEISGTISTGNPITYTFPEPGVYPGVLTVTNLISEVVYPFEIIITGDSTLDLAKSFEDLGGAPLQVGDELLYTVVVTNLLSGEHPGIVITDAIPANTTYVAGSASVSQGSVSGPDPLLADVGTLAGGASATLTFRVTVGEGALGQVVENSAQADSPVQEPPLEVGPIQAPETGVVMPYGSPPTISKIRHQYTTLNTPITIDFEISDAETPAEALTLTVQSLSQPATLLEDYGLGGSGENRSISITPTTGLSGTIGITITVDDGDYTASAGFTLYVAVNAPPVAEDDTPIVPEGIASVIDVLDNDYDPNGDVMTVTMVGAVAHGTLSTDGATVTYTPTQGYTGSDSFSYIISDGMFTDTALVSLEVWPVTDLAVSQDVTEDIAHSIFTLVARNLGARPADGAVISDTFGVEFTDVTWICVGANGATCTASGSGNVLSDTLTSFPSGGVVTYTVTTVSPLDVILYNTVSITPPYGVFDLDMDNNVSTRPTKYRIILPLVFMNAEGR